MFTLGFEKIALHPIVIPAAFVGSLAGSLIAGKKSSDVMQKELLESKNKIDTKKYFDASKQDLPKNTVLYTNKDLHKKVKDTKDIGEMRFWQMLRAATEGNAAAMPESESKPGPVRKRLLSALGIKAPQELEGKNIVFADDKVPASVMAHELGHIIDFDEERKGGLSKKLQNAFSLPYRSERAAWDKAPKHGIKDEEFNRVRKNMLGTYYNGLIYPLVGAGAGALTAGLITRGK